MAIPVDKDLLHWLDLHPIGQLQEKAASSEATEILLLGSAGSGKSHLLLILASKDHRQSVIFRRGYATIDGSLSRYLVQLFLMRG